MFELLTTIITAAVGYVVYYAQLTAKARLAPKTLDLVFGIARTAVAAAEEVGQAANASSADKFDVAAAMLKASAKRAGVKLTPEELTGYVHAALRDMRG